MIVSQYGDWPNQQETAWFSHLMSFSSSLSWNGQRKYWRQENDPEVGLVKMNKSQFSLKN